MSVSRLGALLVCIALLIAGLSGCATVNAELFVGKNLRTSGTVTMILDRQAVVKHYGTTDPAEGIATDIAAFSASAPEGVRASVEDTPSGYTVRIDFDDVKLKPLPAQSGRTFVAYLAPRVDVVKDQYLFQTFHPAMALFSTADIDEALARLRDEVTAMTMTVTFPGVISDAPDATTIDGRTAHFDLTEVDSERIVIRADPPQFRWPVATLIPLTLAAVIGCGFLVIDRLSRTSDQIDQMQTAGLRT